MYKDEVVTHMTNLSLLFHDQVTRRACTLVTDFNDEVKATVNQLFQAATAFEALCLAAPQVGIDLSIFVLNTSEINEQAQAFINPKILHQSGETSYVSNCLHFPGIDYTLKRPKTIELSYFDENGQEHLMTAQNGLASIIAYQVDSLNGILITDHMSKLKRNMFIKKFEKAMLHHHGCGESCGHDHH